MNTQQWEAQEIAYRRVQSLKPAVTRVVQNYAKNQAAAAKCVPSVGQLVYLKECVVFSRVSPELTPLLGSPAKWPVELTYRQMSECFLAAGYIEEKWWESGFHERLMLFKDIFEQNYKETELRVSRKKMSVKFHSNA